MSHHDHHHHHHDDHDKHRHSHQHESLHDHDDDPPEHGGSSRSGSDERLPERAKLIKILEHWIHHNEDHATSYGEWAERAHRLGEEATGKILEGIAAEAIRQNEKLREALKLINRETEPR